MFSKERGKKAWSWTNREVGTIWEEMGEGKPRSEYIIWKNLFIVSSHIKKISNLLRSSVGEEHLVCNHEA